MSSSSDFEDDFSWKLKINGSDCDEMVKSPPSDEEFRGEDDDDFSFACIAPDESPISADDVFQNGQIKPIYPWFDRSILFAGDSVDLPHRPPVKNVFIEPPPPQAAANGDLESSHCEWSGKAVEASPEICKKSNSTGFSKLWRFRDLLNRSNSDGRDAFVFLNGSATSPEKKSAAGDAKSNGGVGAKVKGKKNKTASLSPHELHYVRNRAVREEDRRRSYLPYRPELVGFFTNVRGGLSRNVHPY